MTRAKYFFSALFAGYASLAANFLFTFLSVPIALHFLSKEQFGLWALVVQLGGYLMLVDLGMSTSVARFLADFKDSKDEAEAYGDVLKTGELVFAIQALFVAFLAAACAFLLPAWLKLPPSLVGDFQKLIFLQGVVLAIGLAFRGKSSPLWAHQRIDITHWAATANLLTSLLVMSAGLYFGWGVDSLWAASAAGALWTWILPWIACHRLHLYPKTLQHSSFQKALFFKMFGFARDVLLIQLGGLLCSGSQIILVTKFLGLEAAAVFSIATKTLTMSQQLVGRILESAAPGLTELFVRGERKRFAARFYQVTAISITFATLIGLTLMGVNRAFVSIWTHGKVQWGFLGDALIGTVLIFTVASRCFQGLFGITGELTRIRYLSLVEGMIFIILTWALQGRGGLEGVVASALLANFTVSFLGGRWQVVKALPMSVSITKVFVLLISSYILAGYFIKAAPTFFVSPQAEIIATIITGVICSFVFLKAVHPIFKRGP